MNIIKPKLARSQRPGAYRHGFNRHGLSVIEVLTSIVVALIGVFGVLAMIPFSVKQTQSGLDQDAATSMARNALADFEATGFKVASDNPTGGPGKLLNWVDGGGNNISTAVVPTTSLVCIDPLGITDGGVTSFPFGNSPLLPADLRLPNQFLIGAANLSLPNSGAFTSADARRMFRLTDDLVFAQSDDPNVTDSDLLGPAQIFNEGPAGLLNRQSNGTVSWCAIAQPIINDAEAETFDSYKFYVLVFKDRVITPADPEDAMVAMPLTAPIAPAVVNPLSNVSFSIPSNEDSREILENNLRRNDWVMLINQEATPAPAAFRTNVAFARITNLDNSSGTWNLSLQGPNFTFPAGSTTHLVHLNNVVAVFPRTIKLETNSGWTVSAD